jgi:phosphate transport system protein
MRARLDEAVGELELALQREANLVLRALRCALNALEQQDAELADEVIAFDDEIDDLCGQIHESLHALLASHAPVAVDLRQALGILHVNLHLERAADESVTVAKLAQLTADLDRDESLLGALGEMGARAEEMIQTSVDAFLRHDLPAAESLVALDELIDRANRRVVRQLLRRANDSALEWGLLMVVAARSLERIGDHAVDIGEQTAYMITGEFREFTDASRPRDAA